MSTNYHTPEAVDGTTMEAADVNNPLGELDAAITTNVASILANAGVGSANAADIAAEIVRATAAEAVNAADIATNTAAIPAAVTRIASRSTLNGALSGGEASFVADDGDIRGAYAILSAYTDSAEIVTVAGKSGTTYTASVTNAHADGAAIMWLDDISTVKVAWFGDDIQAAIDAFSSGAFDIAPVILLDTAKTYETDTMITLSHTDDYGVQIVGARREKTQNAYENRAMPTIKATASMDAVVSIESHYCGISGVRIDGADLATSALRIWNEATSVVRPFVEYCRLENATYGLRVSPALYPRFIGVGTQYTEYGLYSVADDAGVTYYGSNHGYDMHCSFGGSTRGWWVEGVHTSYHLDIEAQPSEAFITVSGTSSVVMINPYIETGDATDKIAVDRQGGSLTIISPSFYGSGGGASGSIAFQIAGSDPLAVTGAGLVTEWETCFAGNMPTNGMVLAPTVKFNNYTNSGIASLAGGNIESRPRSIFFAPAAGANLGDTIVYGHEYYRKWDDSNIGDFNAIAASVHELDATIATSIFSAPDTDAMWRGHVFTIIGDGITTLRHGSPRRFDLASETNSIIPAGEAVSFVIDDTNTAREIGTASTGW